MMTRPWHVCGGMDRRSRWVYEGVWKGGGEVGGGGEGGGGKGSMWECVKQHSGGRYCAVGKVCLCG